MRRLMRPVVAVLAALAILPAVATPQQAAADVDVYTTPGTHVVNGREWRTTCEPYSQTKRCRTEIKATVVSYTGGKFVQTTGWAFNNLTYAASPRMLWEGNPLGGNGVVGGKVEWKGTDGRTWRTECDTAATGRFGCRSYIQASVIESYSSGGGTAFRWVNKWVMNNMVRFRALTVDDIVDKNLKACVKDAAKKAGGVNKIDELDCQGRGITTLRGMPDLPAVEEIALTDNKLTSLAGLPAAPRLEYLDVYDNAVTGTINLSALPQTSLMVDLGRNKVTGVTGNAPKLAVLMLDENNLTSVANLAKVTSLKKLTLEKNPKITDLKSLQPLVDAGCAIDIWQD